MNGTCPNCGFPWWHAQEPGLQVPDSYRWQMQQAASYPQQLPPELFQGLGQIGNGPSWQYRDESDYDWLL